MTRPAFGTGNIERIHRGSHVFLSMLDQILAGLPDDDAAAAAADGGADDGDGDDDADGRRGRARRAGHLPTAHTFIVAGDGSGGQGVLFNLNAARARIEAVSTPKPKPKQLPYHRHCVTPTTLMEWSALPITWICRTSPVVLSRLQFASHSMLISTIR